MVVASIAARTRRFVARCGSRLVIAQGPAATTLVGLAEATGARSVVWNRRYEPAVIARDQAVHSHLAERGVATAVSNGALLIEPERMRTSTGGPFQVFTPFWRAYLASLAATPPRAPLPAPRRLPAPARWPDSLPIGQLALLPTIDWAQGLRDSWMPGEAGARRRLHEFLLDAVDRYGQARDLPGVQGTSRLSPHLHHR